jgi:hypothetical protein
MNWPSRSSDGKGGMACAWSSETDTSFTLGGKALSRSDLRNSGQDSELSLSAALKTSQPSAAAAARKARQARISPVSDAHTLLRACLATCQRGLF